MQYKDQYAAGSHKKAIVLLFISTQLLIQFINLLGGNMRKRIQFLIVCSFLFLFGYSTLFAQWAENKNAREDAMYARVLQGSEDVTIDGVEDAIWAKADSVSYLVMVKLQICQAAGIFGKKVTHDLDDSANVVFKCLYKAPYIYLLFKSKDKNVGGVDWEQSDGIIISFKGYVGYINNMR